MYPNTKNEFEIKFDDFFSKMIPLFQKKIKTLDGMRWIRTLKTDDLYNDGKFFF
jgi:hypothetical protein